MAVETLPHWLWCEANCTTGDDRLRWFGCGLWTKEYAERKQDVSFHIVLVKRNENKANFSVVSVDIGSQAQLITACS